MAKAKIILLNLFLIAGCISYAGTIGSVTELYRSQIGIRELSGKNDGREVEMYLASCGLKKGNAWCAAFVSWTFKESGVQAVISAWSPNWFPSKNTVYTRGNSDNKIPQPADVFGIYFPEKKRIAHVGFIDDWPEGSYAITVEGNTNDAGSREGDGVYRKRRLKKQFYKISRWL